MKQLVLFLLITSSVYAMQQEQPPQGQVGDGEKLAKEALRKRLSSGSLPPITAEGERLSDESAEGAAHKGTLARRSSSMPDPVAPQRVSTELPEHQRDR